jgi:hypothetical protein
MTNNRTDYRDAHDAFTMIDSITTCDCPDIIPRDRLCMHTLAASALRDLLIDRDATRTPNNATPPLPFDIDAPDFIYDFIRACLAIIDDAPYQTDRMTAMLLDNSLCPLHAIDYAICFDDDDPDCAAIRLIHPSHDT